MNDRPPDIRTAIDDYFADVNTPPFLQYRVLAQTRGGRTVKKKRSIGLVLLIVLALAAVTALAAALLWQQQVIPMKEIEQSEGGYMNWPVSQKMVLIQALIDSGNITESAETARLLDGATAESEKHAIADRLVLTLTGQTDVKEITVDIITYAIMGSTDTWTPEQRVWWQQVTEQFHGDEGSPDTLITPARDVISEKEAVAIAKEAVMAAWNDSSDVLENALVVADLYVTDQRPDYRRWNIQFKLLREDGYVERIRAVIVDEYGKVIADPDVNMPSVQELAANARAKQEAEASPIVQAYMKYAEQANDAPFQQWPLALKAAYSQEVRPMVQLALSNGEMKEYNADGVGPTEKTIIASTTYAYGLPGQGGISEADALAKATRELLERYHQNAEDFLFTFTYFDVTDLTRPLWRFVFLPASLPDTNMNHLYKIELDAYTGDVVSTKEVEEQQLLLRLDYDEMLY